MTAHGSDALVIGGGIAGLATAALLGEEGYRVTLLEARDELGGRAGSWERDGFRFDTGPSWYLMPEVFDHFFRLLGTTAAAELDLVPLTPAYRVYAQSHLGADSSPLDVVSGRAAARELFDSVEPGAGERLDAYLDSAGEAYDLAVSRFLYDTFESLANLADPVILRRLGHLTALLTVPLATHIEKRFTDTRLRQILGYAGVFLGGSPYELPSLYHLMSHLDLDDHVRYPRGGFAALMAVFERLAVERGARIETGAEVTRIEVADGRVRGAQTADGRRFAADVVVSAADLHHTETVLLPPGSRTYPERWWRRKVPSYGVLLVLLGVRGTLPQLAHHTLLFTEDWRANFAEILGPDARIPDPASLYVCRPSATDDTVAPPGHENLFVLVPIPADPSLGRGGPDGTGDDVIERAADAAIEQISVWCGIDDLRERIVVRRTIGPGDFESELHAWRGNALGLAHPLRQSALFRPRNASARVRGLFYAGSSVLPGIGLPMCLISAELVIKRLRGDRSAGPIPEPVPRTT